MQKIPEADKAKHARDFTERGTGKIVYDTFCEGNRFIVISFHMHFSAYIGVPTDHPLAFRNLDELPFMGEHGGLTFSAGGGNVHPKERYWYGWDYAHAGDYSQSTSEQLVGKDEKDWTLEEVVKDSEPFLRNFTKLARLVE